MKSLLFRGAVLALVLVACSMQRAAAQDTPRGSVARVDTLHNMFVNGQKGLTLELDVQLDGLRDREVTVAAFFDHRDGAALLALPGRYRTPNGQVSVQTKVYPRYNQTDITSIKLFIPYVELHQNRTGRHELRFHIELAYNDAFGPRALAISSHRYIWVRHNTDTAPVTSNPVFNPIIGDTPASLPPQLRPVMVGR